MGMIQEDIASLVDGLTINEGRDCGKVGKRLIEAGIRLLAQEGVISGADNRIAPTNLDAGTFHVTTFSPNVREPQANTLAVAFDVLEVAGQQFLFYAEQHNEKGTPASALKAEVNVRLADMCFKAIDATTERRPVQLAAGVPISAHFPEFAGIAGGGIPADVLENAEKTAQGLENTSSAARRARQAEILATPPCRAEVVAWIMSKAEKSKKQGLEETFFVLQALAGEIEQHLEERQVNTAHALQLFYADCHARNVKAGWWTDLATGISKKRSVGELFMLFVTEIEEAYRAYVEGSQDDKLPQYPGLGVELGDLQIRLADFAGAMLAGALVSHDPDVTNPGDQMFQEVCEIARRYEAIRKTDAAVGDPETGDFIPSVDVAEMVVAKLDFNANRPDHKIENRLKEDGKRT